MKLFQGFKIWDQCCGGDRLRAADFPPNLVNNMDPRPLHGYICLIGFVPMYIAGGFNYDVSWRDGALVASPLDGPLSFFCYLSAPLFLTQLRSIFLSLRRSDTIRY